MSSAKLMDSGRAIIVTLSAEAEATSVPCSDIFSTATMAKLGAASICTSAGNQFLTINMVGELTLVPGTDTLVLLAGQDVLVAKVGAAPFAGSLAGTNAAVATCTNCPAPVASVNGPAILSPPCSLVEAAIAPQYIFDGTSSKDTSGRVLTNAVWALTQGSSAALSAIISAINARTSVG